MYLINVLRNALFLLIPLSIPLTTYLYLYPIFYQCAFPSTDASDDQYGFKNTLLSHIIPSSRPQDAIPSFRLLAFGDPQLEGDTSLPDTSFPHWPSLVDNIRNRWKHGPIDRVRHSLHDLIDLLLADIPWWFEGYRKRLDLFGNDYYLAHIYRTLHWWTRPTHVSVLGDLLGSQWIEDDEFEERSRRFWKRVFKGGMKVDEEYMTRRSEKEGPLILQLGDDTDAWKRRIINIAGNHDIGYAGDLDIPRIERFEREFGQVNYELRFQLLNYTTTAVNAEGGIVVEVPELRIVVLNSMNLDTPVGSAQLQEETYEFLNHVITSSHPVDRKAHFTLLLTHIPLYKKEGVCVDAPFFDFYDGEYENGIKEQNHLSAEASKAVLEGIYGMSGDNTVDGGGMGRRGLIINGHDHEGCDVYHYVDQVSTSAEQSTTPPVSQETASEVVRPTLSEEPLDSLQEMSIQLNEETTSEPVHETTTDQPTPKPTWQATRHDTSNPFPPTNPSHQTPAIRELTLRSMMGDYSGNAGLISITYNPNTSSWTYAITNCSLGKSNIWWIVHVIDIITILCLSIYIVWKSLLAMGIAGRGEIRIEILELLGLDRPGTSKDAEHSRTNITKGMNGRMSISKKNGILINPGKESHTSGSGIGSGRLRKRKSKNRLNNAQHANANEDRNESQHTTTSTELSAPRRALSCVFERPEIPTP